jgi:4-amino-4-deoxy-L-arabinose transferase-like glycosyltransferase
MDERATTGQRLGTRLSWLERATATPWQASGWLILATLVLFLPGFFTLPPIDRDEPRFAQASKQMIETRDFVSIRFQGEARNKKPVGIYWLQAGAVEAAAALGMPQAQVTIWLYRLPSLLGAIAAALLTYWAALAFTTRPYAFLAALLFSCTALIGFEARLAKTDAVIAATVVAAMGAFARIVLDRKRTTPAKASRLALPAIFWTAIAAGILVKGPITPMVALLAGLVVMALERWRGAAVAPWLRRLRPGLGLVWCLLLVAPWFILILIETHGAFLADSVGKDMLTKMGSGQELHGAPPGTYFLAFFVTGWPLAPFALLAAVFAWRHRHEPAVTLLLAWLVPSWLVFEAVPTKLPHYVLPLYPAIAILTALAVQHGEAAARRLPLRVLATAVSLLVPLGIPAAAIVIALRYGTALPASFYLLAPLIVIVAAWAAVEIWTRWGSPLGRAAETTAPAFFLLAALLGAMLFQGLASGAFFAPFALSPRLAAASEAALRNEPTCNHLGFATTSYREPSLVFLTSTSLLMTDPAGAADFLSAEPCRAAFVEAREETAFEAALAAGAPVALVSRVEGINLNGGKKLDIGVYVRGGPKS